MTDHPIIERLLETGGRTAVPFVGFRATREDGRIRLYQTPGTEAFIEIERGDVLHVEEPERASGSTVVWVGEAAEVRVVVERTVGVREIRPAPERPAPPPPGGSGGGVTAGAAQVSTACAGGLEIVFCMRLAKDALGNLIEIPRGFSIHSAHLTCGPGRVHYILC